MRSTALLFFLTLVVLVIISDSGDTNAMMSLHSLVGRGERPVKTMGHLNAAEGEKKTKRAGKGRSRFLSRRGLLDGVLGGSLLGGSSSSDDNGDQDENQDGVGGLAGGLGVGNGDNTNSESVHGHSKSQGPDEELSTGAGIHSKAHDQGGSPNGQGQRKEANEGQDVDTKEYIQSQRADSGNQGQSQLSNADTGQSVQDDSQTQKQNEHAHASPESTIEEKKGTDWNDDSGGFDSNGEQGPPREEGGKKQPETVSTPPTKPQNPPETNLQTNSQPLMQDKEGKMSGGAGHKGEDKVQQPSDAGSGEVQGGVSSNEQEQQANTKEHDTTEGALAGVTGDKGALDITTGDEGTLSEVTGGNDALGGLSGQGSNHAPPSQDSSQGQDGKESPPVKANDPVEHKEQGGPKSGDNTAQHESPQPVDLGTSGGLLGLEAAQPPSGDKKADIGSSPSNGNEASNGGLQTSQGHNESSQSSQSNQGSQGGHVGDHADSGNGGALESVTGGLGGDSQSGLLGQDKGQASSGKPDGQESKQGQTKNGGNPNSGNIQLASSGENGQGSKQDQSQNGSSQGGFLGATSSQQDTHQNDGPVVGGLLGGGQGGNTGSTKAGTEKSLSEPPVKEGGVGILNTDDAKQGGLLDSGSQQGSSNGQPSTQPSASPNSGGLPGRVKSGKGGDVEASGNDWSQLAQDGGKGGQDGQQPKAEEQKGDNGGLLASTAGVGNQGASGSTTGGMSSANLLGSQGGNQQADSGNGGLLKAPVQDGQGTGTTSKGSNVQGLDIATGAPQGQNPNGNNGGLMTTTAQGGQGTGSSTNGSTGSGLTGSKAGGTDTAPIAPLTQEPSGGLLSSLTKSGQSTGSTTNGSTGSGLTGAKEGGLDTASVATQGQGQNDNNGGLLSAPARGGQGSDSASNNLTGADLMNSNVADQGAPPATGQGQDKNNTNGGLLGATGGSSAGLASTNAVTGATIGGSSTAGLLGSTAATQGAGDKALGGDKAAATAGLSVDKATAAGLSAADQLKAGPTEPTVSSLDPNAPSTTLTDAGAAGGKLLPDETAGNKTTTDPDGPLTSSTLSSDKLNQPAQGTGMSSDKGTAFGYADRQKLILPNEDSQGGPPAEDTVQTSVADPNSTAVQGTPKGGEGGRPSVPVIASTIAPKGASATQPANTTMTAFLFKPILGWSFLASSPDTVAQLFLYMPSIIGEAVDLDARNVSTIRLQSHFPDGQTSKDPSKGLSLYLAYVPTSVAKTLQGLAKDPKSKFYTMPKDSVAKALVENVDPNYDILSMESVHTANKVASEQSSHDTRATLRNALIGVGSALAACILAFLAWRIWKRNQKQQSRQNARQSMMSGGVGGGGRTRTIQSFGGGGNNLRETWAPSIHEQERVLHGQLAETWEHNDAGNPQHGQQSAAGPREMTAIAGGAAASSHGHSDPFYDQSGSIGSQEVHRFGGASSPRRDTLLSHLNHYDTRSNASVSSGLTEAQRIQQSYIESAGSGQNPAPDSSSTRAGSYQEVYERPQQFTSSHAYGPRVADSRARRRASKGSVSGNSIGRPEMQGNSMLI